ncbi:phospholipase D family protein [Porphyromonas catoniae]|jgi:hypothetical protein|uniref:PLD-like domain protein n=1 Tax=Porphyromonas catoniae ATCC 51270 TaxID=887901 RepID=Z4WVR8_9PORP|nr:phospholipase D family protein [Porphyromonas catoniae]EWC91574.1 PLD-like domain protein [Porphyromonas catoniae ATCC 51270]
MNTILSGQNLVNALREHCDQAKKRIWIASPYIGNFKDVQKIIGGNWMRSHIDFRVLTDVESGFIRRDTYAQFKESPNTEIRSLLSLHAKIYLIDDWCLLTSANLTGMAFSARHEVGQVVSGIEQVVTLFDQWWKKAQAVSSLPPSPSKTITNKEDSTKYKVLYKLPKYTSGASDQFLKKCDQFKELASLYESVTGRNQQMVREGFSLYEELDYFFNFLYHDHPDKPSKGCNKNRSLTSREVKQEILRYFELMSMSYAPGSGLWRLDRRNRIRELLPFKAGDSPRKEKIEEVLECLHCLHSRPLNKTKILSENDPRSIARAWNRLIQAPSINSQLIEEVIGEIKYFGISSASELIAWYYPEKYPMINLNSESGMRFFGFNI